MLGVRNIMDSSNYIPQSQNYNKVKDEGSSIKHEHYEAIYHLNDKYKKYDEKYNLINNGQLHLPVKTEKYAPYDSINVNNKNGTNSNMIQELYEGNELLDILEISNNTTNNTTTPAVTSFLCEFCNKRFFKKQQLENHTKIHKNIRNFSCDFCTKRFIHKQQMQNHMKTHTGEKNFHCNYCSKQFIHKQQLENHIKTHTGEKNFECETCNKKFTLKQQLQNHLKIHLGIKPFSCELCDRRFTLKQQLNNHTKTHLGLKEFSCFDCTKAFATKQQRAAHIKIHEKRKLQGIDSNQLKPNKNLYKEENQTA